MVNFAQLKSNRAAALETLKAEAAKTNDKKTYEKDERYWQPTVDKAGNGNAVIRFLPAIEGESVSWVRYWDHGFQGPGGWYIENSLTTLGQEDPVSEYNSKLWAIDPKNEHCPFKKQARDQKRRLHYVSNILVVKDPANPANDGKVFLYKYGKKIFDKLNAAMNPQFDDQEAVNPFDMWEGANFRLRITKEDGYRSYNSSDFAAATAIAKSDEAIENIWRQGFALQPILDPANFKSYGTLKERLNRVLGLAKTGKVVEEDSGDDEVEERFPEPRGKVAEQKSVGRTASVAAADIDDDEAEFFKNLRDDD